MYTQVFIFEYTKFLTKACIISGSEFRIEGKTCFHGSWFRLVVYERIDYPNFGAKLKPVWSTKTSPVMDSRLNLNPRPKLSKFIATQNRTRADVAHLLPIFALNTVRTVKILTDQFWLDAAYRSFIVLFWFDSMCAEWIQNYSVLKIFTLPETARLRPLMAYEHFFPGVGHGQIRDVQAALKFMWSCSARILIFSCASCGSDSHKLIGSNLVWSPSSIFYTWETALFR